MQNNGRYRITFDTTEEIERVILGDEHKLFAGIKSRILTEIVGSFVALLAGKTVEEQRQVVGDLIAGRMKLKMEKQDGPR